MQGYGPISVVSGTVVGQTVDQSADRILLSNRSIYDVLVSFQVAQPVPSSVLSPAWPIVVHAGDQVVYTLRKDDRTPTPLGTYWQGNVWLCATAQQAGLALSGSKSASSQFWITALHPGDPTPALAARPTWVDASSQLRVVSVPVPMLQYWTATHAISGATSFNSNFFWMPQNSGNVTESYLHFLAVTITTANASLQVSPGTVWFDSSGVVIPNSFVAWAQFFLIGICNFVIPFSNPPAIGGTQGQVIGSQTTYQLGVQINLGAPSTNTTIGWTIGWTADIRAGAVVPPIGDGTANVGPIY